MQDKTDERDNAKWYLVLDLDGHCFQSGRLPDDGYFECGFSCLELFNSHSIRQRIRGLKHVSSLHIMSNRQIIEEEVTC